MLLICKLLVVASLLWNVVSTVTIYPHQLAYFNESAGGPKNGHKHLLGSNLDWGQDLLAVKRAVSGGFIETPVAIAYAGPMHHLCLNVPTCSIDLEGGVVRNKGCRSLAVSINSMMTPERMRTNIRTDNLIKGDPLDIVEDFQFTGRAGATFLLYGRE